MARTVGYYQPETEFVCWECARAETICNQAIDRHSDVELVREFQELQTIKVDKHKLMEILVNLIQNVAETLLFFHPAVWWLSSEIRREREHCCDGASADCSAC